MKKTKKQITDVITPDLVKIDNLGLLLHHVDEDAVCFSFDGTRIYFHETFTHPYIHRAIKKENVLDLRYWKNSNIMTIWVYEGDVIKELKAFHNAFNNNVITNIRKMAEKDKRKIDIDMDNVILLFSEKENDDEYIIQCRFDELDMVNNISTNYENRPLHLLTPSEKNIKLETDKNLKRERDLYNIEGKRAWIRKHGSMDPAEYHLLKYEE